MAGTREPATTMRRWAMLAGLTALYVLTGKVGLHFAFVHASATAVWPPTGIALAAFLLFGPRVTLAIAAGAFLVNVTTAGSIATSVGIAAGNTLEGFLAATLVERFANGRHAFERASDIFAFGLAVVPATLVSATIGVVSLAAGGYAAWPDFGSIAATWALGDLTGALIVAPLLLLWADRRASPVLGHPLEAIGLLLSILLTGQVAFGGLLPHGFERYPLVFLCFAPLVWAACRFGRRAAATAVVLLSGIALYQTRQGLGPFALVPQAHALLILQAFMATMSLVTLVIAALVWVRDRESSMLQAIIDRIPVMISVYEPNTKVVRLNPEFERLTGWTTDAARQVDLMAQCYPDPTYRAQVRAFMNGLSNDWHDIEMTTRDGQTVATSWTNVRLADDTRVGIGLDIREQKRLEAERERARAQAEAASRAKDEFFAILGHELRNPLNAIAVWMHVVETTGSLDPNARQIIGKQVRHLTRLVDDLLDVNRLDTGKIELRRSPVDLGVTTRRIVVTIAEGAPDRQIVCDALDDLWIQADETRLEQILVNLLNNAVKFTPVDGRITVVATRDGDNALVRIEDTGVGIPAELLPRIFDLFVQGRTGLHRKGAGLGIGLTLVKRLVDLHDGRVEVTSPGPSKGSTFAVRFPLISPVRRAAAPEAAPPEFRARRRILVVEDDQDTRRMLCRLLALSGHEVYEADDGVRGLEQALALGPEVVLLDIGLPGLDGYQVARHIRAAGRSDMMLIAVTGYGQVEDRLRAKEAGFDSHITKPVNPTVLAALLTQQPLA